MTKDKIDQMREEILYNNLKSCSFKPKINDNSRKITKQKALYLEEQFSPDEYQNGDPSAQPDQFTILYDDAMKRIERHQKIYSM